MPGRDRYRFLGRLPQQDKTPILAQAPEPKVAGATATLRLYDPIDSWGGWWGVSAKEFTAALDELPESVTTIELLINSPGGDVFEGIAILNALRRHQARVVAVVEGLAASAASLIAVGADEVVMGRNAELMIHDAWGICIGNAEDMTDMAANLGRISDNLARVYADKAGGDMEQWRAAMRAETWYSDVEAVDAGLADRVDERTVADDGAKARFDLSAFNYAGRAAAPSPPPKAAPEPSPAPAVEPVASGDTPQESGRAVVKAKRSELEFIESAHRAA